MWRSPSSTSLEHLIQNSPQSVVLQRRSHPLLVCKLLVDLIILSVAVFLASDFDPIIWRQGLLEADTYPQTDHGSKRAVGNGGSDLERHVDDGVGIRDSQRGSRRDMDV